jgi:hypothetical protein
VKANSFVSDDVFSHSPVPGLLKSGIPAEVLIPAPVRTEIFSDARINSATRRIIPPPPFLMLVYDPIWYSNRSDL